MTNQKKVMAPRGKELSKDLKDLIIMYFKESKTVRGIAEIVKKALQRYKKLLRSIKLWVLLRISLDLVALVRLHQ